MDQPLTRLQLASPGAFDKYCSRFSPEISSRLSELYPSPDPSATISFPAHPASRLLAAQVFLAPRETFAKSLSLASDPPSIRFFDFNALLPNMSEGPLSSFGAYHAIEIPFVFGTRTFWKVGSDEEKTSEEIIRRYASLIVGEGGAGTGSEWPVWTKSEQKRLVFGPEGGVVSIGEGNQDGLERERCEYWMKMIENGVDTSLSG